MTLVLFGIQKIYEIGRELYSAYSEVMGDSHGDYQRLKTLVEAVDLLRSEGYPLVNVEAAFEEYDEGCSSDIPVSILFQVEARAGKYADQHVAYAVDISSWKALWNDLDTLGRKFADANERAYQTKDYPSDFLKTDYAEFLDKVQKRGLSEPKL
jgi:hypothetical protein